MIRTKKGRAEYRIGLVLIASALCLTGYNIWSSWRAGKASRAALEQFRSALPSATVPAAAQPVPSGSGAPVRPSEPAAGETAVPDYVLNPEMDMPESRIDGLSYMGVLDIPALGLELPVLSDYVFEHLRVAPCRFSGTAYRDDLVICAHNYASHFGRLGSLSVGDRVALTDLDGNVFSYAVQEIIVLNPSEPEAFTDSGYPLTLFTCTVDGTARVAVRCVQNAP